MNQDDDYWIERDEAWRKGSPCRCGEMPGRCPGPSFCPCEETGEENEEDEEGA